MVLQILFSTWVLFVFSALKPYYFKPAAVNIDYNIQYTRNTFISPSRAISDYLLSVRYVNRCMFQLLPYNIANIKKL